MGPRAGQDRCRKSSPHWDLIPGLSSLKPVAIPTMLPGPRVILEFNCSRGMVSGDLQWLLVVARVGKRAEWHIAVNKGGIASQQQSVWTKWRRGGTRCNRRASLKDVQHPELY